MHLTGLDLFFWVAGLAGHILLLCVLLVRRRARTFPFFTAFIVSNIVRTICLFFVRYYAGKTAYFDAYWSLEIVDTVLQLAVFYEIASSVFRPVGVWASDVRKRVLLWIAAGIAVACFLTWQASPPTKHLYQTVVIKGDLLVALLLTELFAIIVVISSNAGLAWRHHVRNIADGLGVYSIANAIVDGVHTHFGADLKLYELVSHIRIWLYLACLTYWIVTLWRDEPQRKEITPELRAKLFAWSGKLEYDLARIKSGVRRE